MWVRRCTFRLIDVVISSLAVIAAQLTWEQSEQELTKVTLKPLPSVLIILAQKVEIYRNPTSEVILFF